MSSTDSDLVTSHFQRAPSAVRTAAPLVWELAVASNRSRSRTGQRASEKRDAEKGREMIREARLEIVHSELQLTEEEAAGFWPVYTTYRAETDSIQDRYAAMVAEYVRRYDNADLTDEYADELMATYFGLKRELLDIREKFLPEFRDVLPALKVARLYQLENKISAEIDAQLALAVPLVDPS